jgi:polar amino acid transport system permease protein
MNILELSLYVIPFLIKGIVETAKYSLICGILGLIIGIIGGLSRISKSYILRIISAIYVNIFRSTPFLIQLYIIFFILPIYGIVLNSSQAAIITLSFNFGAYMSEMVRAGIEAIPKEQTEAALSLGMTPFLKTKLVILPQALRIIIPPVVGQLILLVKDTAIISLIGAFEVTKVGRELVVGSGLNPIIVYSWVSFFYFIICYPLYLYSIKIEKKLKFYSF